MIAHRESVTVPLWLLERAIQCIARAEVESAFAACATPQIGARTLEALEAISRNHKGA